MEIAVLAHPGGETPKVEEYLGHLADIMALHGGRIKWLMGIGGFKTDSNWGEEGITVYWHSWSCMDEGGRHDDGICFPSGRFLEGL